MIIKNVPESLITNLFRLITFLYLTLAHKTREIFPFTVNVKFK